MNPLFPVPVEVADRRVSVCSFVGVLAGDAPSAAVIYSADQQGIYLVTVTGHITTATAGTGSEIQAAITTTYLPGDVQPIESTLIFDIPTDCYAIGTLFLAVNDSLTLSLFPSDGGEPDNSADFYITIQRLL